MFWCIGGGGKRGGGGEGVPGGLGRDRTGEVLGEVWVEMGRGDERDGMGNRMSG